MGTESTQTSFRAANGSTGVRPALGVGRRTCRARPVTPDPPDPAALGQNQPAVHPAGRGRPEDKRIVRATCVSHRSWIWRSSPRVSRHLSSSPCCAILDATSVRATCWHHPVWRRGTPTCCWLPRAAFQRCGPRPATPAPDRTAHRTGGCSPRDMTERRVRVDIEKCPRASIPASSARPSTIAVTRAVCSVSARRNTRRS